MQSLAGEDAPTLEAMGGDALSQEPAAGVTLPAPLDPSTPASLPCALVQSFAGVLGTGAVAQETSLQTAEPTAHAPHSAGLAPAAIPPAAPNTATPLAMADPKPPGHARLPAQAPSTPPAGLQAALPPGLAMPLNAEPPVASGLAVAAREAAMALADTRRPDTAGVSLSTPSIAAATLDLAAAGVPSSAPSGAVHEAEITASPREAAFASELAAQVEVMVDGDLHVAQLRLNPVDLGPIRIELRMDGTTADVVFTAAHELTREGISRSLDELRDMLASQGLSLGQTQVGTRHGGQGHDDAPQGQSLGHTRSHSPGLSGTADAAAPSALRPRALRGMLDLYA